METIRGWTSSCRKSPEPVCPDPWLQDLYPIPRPCQIEGPLKVSSVQDAHPDELSHGPKGKGRDVPFAGTSRRPWFANSGGTGRARGSQRASDTQGFSESADQVEIPSDDTSNLQTPHTLVLVFCLT
jgi:hypothetical protein